MSTTFVSQLPGYFFSLCTGRALFLPFKPLGKSLSQGFSLFHNYTYCTVSLHVSLNVTVTICFQCVAIQLSVVNAILFYFTVGRIMTST